MKERLTKLIKEAQERYIYAEEQAQYLIENGVIVPPCKVGVKVYFSVRDCGECLDGNLVSYSIDAARLWFNCHYDCGLNYWHPIEAFGKTVFLTREEAERALKGGADNG